MPNRTPFDPKMLHAELIPAAEKGSSRLMIMMHGLGDSIEGYRGFAAALAPDLPWLNFLLVNAPDEYYGGYSWFDFPDNIPPGVVRSRKLLFELLDGLPKKGFPIDQVTLGGFSQGCVMTVDVGLRYPHKLAGLVGLSGWVYEIDGLLKEASPVAKQQRLLMTHGPFDEILPFDEVKKQAQQLKTEGFDVTWREFPKGHTIYGKQEMDVIRDFVRAGYPGK